MPFFPDISVVKTHEPAALDNVGKFVDPQELKNIIPGKSNRFKKIPFITTGKRTPVLI